MEALKRARRPVRREFDNIYRELEHLTTEENVRMEEVAVQIKLLNNAFEQLREHDNKVINQLMSEKAKEEDENKEYDEIQEFKCRVEKMRQKVEKILPPVSTQGPESDSGIVQGEVRVRNFKLAPVQIPKFTGELRNWLGFWAQFQKIDDDVTMHASDKFFYLLQALEPGSDAYVIASGYPLTNENYPKVVTALKKRYGDRDLQLQVYIRDLLSLVISSVSGKEKLPLKTLFHKLDSHLRALKTLELEKADPATWLFPLVESSLPESVLLNWQRDPLSSYDGGQEDPPRSRLDVLMGYLEREVGIQQRLDITKSFSQAQVRQNTRDAEGSHQDYPRSRKRNHVPTLSSFSVGNIGHCAFCDKTNHPSGKCFKAKAMSYEDRLTVLKRKKLCYRCCGDHLAKQCDNDKLECAICHRSHLTMLCRENKRRDEQRGSSSSTGSPQRKKPRIELTAIPTTQTNANVVCSGDVALQTLIIKISSGAKEKTLRAFIDCGSQRSYILASTSRELEMEPAGIEKVIHSLFGGKLSKKTTHNKFKVILRSLDGAFEKSVELRGHEKLSADIPTVPGKLRDELSFRGITLNSLEYEYPRIEVLIGADLYPFIVTGDIVYVSEGVVGLKTKLGWTVMGEIKGSVFNSSMVAMCLAMSVTDASTAQLWELDTLGIKDPVEAKSEKEKLAEIESEFIKTIAKGKDGRYSVSLPWKLDHPVLSNNKEIALKRVKKTSYKLIEKAMWENYDSILHAWEKEKFIEKVNDDVTIESYYLPHRGVCKPESSTTPLRIVFDASCKVKGTSLNDCLEKGANLIQLIPEIIHRFREKRVAFVSDIRKAFQMIEVAEKDRSSLKFLWWKSKEMTELVVYQHTRVVFGAVCSPFILGAVLKYHLLNVPEEDKEFGEKLLSTFYVDNSLSSEDTLEKYQNFRKKSVEVLARAGMDLREWHSNVENTEDETTRVMSVLGLLWDRKRDELFVKVKGVEMPAKITKRSVLSTCHKLFDPIGIICPAVLQIKLLLQRAWIRKKKWDEQLPQEEANHFIKWYNEVEYLDKCRVPRHSSNGLPGKCSVHIFSDASIVAYSAVVFLRVENEEAVSVQMLAAKSRVSPIKKLSIPRAELMGCVIGARLWSTVKRSLEWDKIPVTFWCDSSVALAWIRNDDLWGTFVGNRTKEINQLSNREQWRHVPGRCNPADLLSRGCSPRQLFCSRWWQGPEWLYEKETEWPQSESQVDDKEVYEERRKASGVPIISVMSILGCKERDRSFNSMVRIVGWIRRFLHNKLIKDTRERLAGKLSRVELERAEIIFLREIQREEFPIEQRKQLSNLELVEDSWGILRVKTRLVYRDDPVAFKYPILLPGKRAEVRRLIQDLHRYYCHAGPGFLCVKLREKY